MQEKILAVLETEGSYAKRFFDFLNEKKDFFFQTRVFTEETSLEEFLKEHSVEILLIAEKSNYKKYEKEVAFTILLTEGRMVKEGEHTVIYKFQSAENILKEVLQNYVEKKAEQGTTMRYLSKGMAHTKKIAIFSPEGGAGKTTTSVLLGNLLGENKNVLVVNLEPFPKEYPWLENDVKQQGISELLYYMEQGKQNLEMKIKSMVCSIGNMDYLKGVSNYQDVQNMKEEDVLYFLEVLQQNTSYDVIIFDISFVGKGILTLMEKSDVIYQPTFQKKASQQWLQVFQEKDRKEMKKKIVEIPLLWEENSRNFSHLEVLMRSENKERIYEICMK